jgi:DNA polymerase-3 subunit alpha
MREFHTEEELQHTIDIANMCTQYDILGPPNPPVFDCPNGMSPNDYLRELCREGWSRKMSHVEKGSLFSEYGDRVNKEIKIFTETNLSSYFLIVEDISQGREEVVLLDVWFLTLWTLRRLIQCRMT